MLHAAHAQYQYLATYAEGLFADVDPAQAFEPLSPGGIHPGWVAGHLAYAGLNVVALLGGDPAGLEPLAKRFGMGETIEAPGATDFEALVETHRDVHRRVGLAVEAATPEALAAENPVAPFRAAFPTAGDMVAFLLTGHEATHLGQLSVWRRSHGGKPLF